GGWTGDAPSPSRQHARPCPGVAELGDDGRDHGPLHCHGLLAVTSRAREPSSSPSGVTKGSSAVWTALLTRATVGGSTFRSSQFPTPVAVQNATGRTLVNPSSCAPRGGLRD